VTPYGSQKWKSHGAYSITHGFHPVFGNGFMGDPFENKRSKSKTFFCPLLCIIKHKGVGLSRNFTYSGLSMVLPRTLDVDFGHPGSRPTNPTVDGRFTQGTPAWQCNEVVARAKPVAILSRGNLKSSLASLGTRLRFTRRDSFSKSGFGLHFPLVRSWYF
jgi:hypothetical protein